MKKNIRFAIALSLTLVFSSCKKEPANTESGTASTADVPATIKAEPAEDPKETKSTETLTKIIMDTSMGSIELELNAQKAPLTVANFLKYVDSKQFDGTIFHRVIQDFMIQGGGFSIAGDEKETLASVKNESSNGLSNSRGTISMARTNHPDSATAQFFINVADNAGLDGAPGRPGYSVFGKVVAGMDVVDAIRAVKTGQKTMRALHPDGRLYPQPFQDVPMKDVIIKTVKRSGSAQ